MKGNYYKKIGALIISCVLLLSVVFNAFISVSISASANNTEPKAIFNYGNYEGVSDAIGTNPDDIVVYGDKFTLPENKNAMNLFWKNGKKRFEAGSTVSIDDLEADNAGNYIFTACFTNTSLDFENIFTDAIKFNLSTGSTNKNLFLELTRNPSYWRVPKGLSNTQVGSYYGTALGHDRVGINAGVGKSGKGLKFSAENYTTPEYRNAVLFTHNPTSFKVTDKISYSYVYFTPDTEYKMEFDYKTTSSVDVAVAFGVNTEWGNGNCGKLSVNSASYDDEGNHISLPSSDGEWKHASITVKSPASYTGNGITSARVGVALRDNAPADSSRSSYLDNIIFYPTAMSNGSVNLVYGSEALGNDSIVFADEEGNFSIPKDDSISNLLWKHGDNLYSPGTKLNIKDLGDDLTLTAYFSGASINFDNIFTDPIKFTLSTGSSTNKNLFLELTRNPSYWRVPKGLSNTQSGSYYGTALGHDRVGINAGVGKSGKGLKFSAENYSSPEYRNAVLFSHNPTSFTVDDNISYSYVYYTPNTEYKMEFDYKTTSQVDVAIAFGVSTAWKNENCGTQSVNSASYDKEGNHISLPSSDGEWKHASITVKSPASYTGYGITSARVGVALRDNAPADSSRASYLDNIVFYPTTMSCDSVKIQYGSETDDNDSDTISYFKFNAPLKSNNSMVLPADGTISACFRSGVNDSGVAWSSRYGLVSNLIGWKLLGSDKVYGVGDDVLVDSLPKNAVFTAIYGDETADFESVDETFNFFTAKKLTYGSENAKIVNENNNNFVRLEQQSDGPEQEYNHFAVFSDINKFAGYNVNSMYKITFKYRRLDNVDKESRIYFAFGTVPYDWRAKANCISKSEVCVAKAGMTEFETVSVIVTSPNKHVYMKSTENFYSRAMSIGADLSDGVIIDIDDIEIKAVGLEGDSFGTATFDFGASDKVEDTKTMRFAESIVLPGKQSPVALTRKGTNENGQKWTASHGYVSNQTAWYCENNNKYYELGQKVDSAEVGNNPKFTAIYEKGEVNFDNLPSDFALVEQGKTSYSSSLAKLQGDSNKYVNITGGEAQKDTSIQVVLFNDKDEFLSYNTDKTYKVTFKYRRTDNLDVKSSMFFAFGATPYDWRASSTCINRVMLGDAKPGMKDFKTVTAYVTAPNTFEFNTGGNSPQYFYSRTMSIGANISNGVSIDFDDISVEAIGREEVAMTFFLPEVNKQTVVIGKVGNPIKIPKINIDRNTVIDGWYTDKSFTKPFTLKAFPSKGMFVYGKTGDAKVRYYGFTDYPWESEIRSDGTYALRPHQTIEKGLSSDGDGYALKIDNTYSGADSEQQGVALPVKVKPNTKYLISYDFYYEKIGDTTSTFSEFWFNTTTSGKVWNGHMQHITNTDEYVPATVETKKWITGYVYGTTTEYTWSNNLALFVRVPIGSVRYIDNIIITEIPENYSVAMFKLGSFQSPAPVVARTNSKITMPKVNLDSKFVFLNWVLNNEDYNQTTYNLAEDTVFTARTTIGKFSDSFENTYFGENGMKSFGMDLDWEIYDSKGKSASNVKSGRYSLHKIGNDPRNGAYCLQHNSDVTKYSMAPGKIYTVTFWTKVENPVHKLGSIDIASCMSLANPWDFSSEVCNVIPIADIADGEWHEVSYTFLASAEYLSFRVPGNLSIYIDGVTVKYTPDSQRSENCEFEEYLPAFLTEDGKYIKPEVVNNKLEKFQLVKRAAAELDNNNSVILIIIVSVVVLLIGAAGIVLFIFIRKKRKMGGNSGEKN